MQYDQPTSAPEILAGLDANGSVTVATRYAIETLLGLTNPAGGSATVGLWDGDSILVSPGGEAPQLLLVTVPGAAGDDIILDIPSQIMSTTQAYIFESDADLTVTWNSVERVIISGDGDDTLTVKGDQDTTIDGAAGDDTIVTRGGDDWVIGSAGDDSISTGAGNDTIVTGVGDDTIDGGEGFDIAAIMGADRDDVDLIINESGQLVMLAAYIDDNDDLILSETETSNIEFIQLADNDAVAIARNVPDQITLSLYQGVLGRAPDAAGAAYWLDYEPVGLGIAESFLESDEFTGKFGDVDDLTDAELVEILYENALDRDPEKAGLDYWVNALEGGEERAAVAVSIITSEEGRENIDSVFLLLGDNA